MIVTVQMNGQLTQARKVFGFHLLNHTGHGSAEDTTTKEIIPQEKFEYDNLDTDHLLLHEYTVRVCMHVLCVRVVCPMCMWHE